MQTTPLAFVRARQLADQLIQHRYTLATAESCTGGGIAQQLTRLPGASQWFRCGWVTYSNDVKERCLGVSADALRCHGAVSEVVALQMAEGALVRGEANLAISTTGIAGPQGGTLDKPVGTVWLGVAYCHHDSASDPKHRVTQARCVHLTGGRYHIQQSAIQMALELALTVLKP